MPAPSTGSPVRGTQSLVHMLAACWHRPSLLGRELLWRWSFGIPALALLVWEGARIYARVSVSETWSGYSANGYSSLSLQDPLTAAQTAAVLAASIYPPVMVALRWLAPLLAATWAVVSGLGRSAVLRRMDASMHSAPLTMVWLQLLRIAALAATCVGWFQAIAWAARATLLQEQPNLVAYSAWIICLTLGAFTLWALLSWIFSIAPLLAMLERRGAWSSLMRSLHLGPLAGKLVEVNLVLGIVKLALIVLAMVFSATPLPFVSQAGANDAAGAASRLALYLWWAAVAVLYCAASDFFQVARLAVFVEFWRVYARGERA